MSRHDGYTERRDAAIAEYLAKGWYVFPVYGVHEDGSCRCGSSICDKVGKHPWLSWNVLASKDPETVAAMFAPYPYANVAIATGPSRLAVIDIDPRHGGDASLSELGRYLGISLNAPTVITQGGGEHYYYSARTAKYKSTSAAFGNSYPGIDVRAEGGYVIAVPSIGAHGEYVWDAGSPESAGPIPKELSPLMQLIGERAPRDSNGTSVTASVRFPAGSRNNNLTRSCGDLFRAGLRDEMLQDAMLDLNASACSPPLPDHEVLTICGSAAAGWQGRSDTKGAGSKMPALLSPRFVDLANIELERIPFLIPDVLPKGEFVIFEGHGAVGKTTVAIDFIASYSSGRPFPGSTESHQGRVLVIAGEDSPMHWKARLMAARADFSNIKLLKGVDDLGTPFKLPDHAELFRSIVVEHDIDFVYIDSFFDHMDADVPNNNVKAREVTRPLIEICHELGITIITTRHWTKAVGHSRVRGIGSADFTNAARCVISFGEEGETPGHMVMAVAKANYGLGSQAPSLLYRIVSHEIEIGDSDPLSVGKIEWLGRSNVTADDLATKEHLSGEEKSMTEACLIDLEQVLRGVWMDAETLNSRMLAHGHARVTWERTRSGAKKNDLIKRRGGNPGTKIEWTWVESSAFEEAVSQPSFPGKQPLRLCEAMPTISAYNGRYDVTPRPVANHREVI